MKECETRRAAEVVGQSVPAYKSGHDRSTSSPTTAVKKSAPVRHCNPSDLPSSPDVKPVGAQR